MLTWLIVKTRIDSSLNFDEHCVACDRDENNCCRRALPGQPCGAAYPAFDLRCTPLFEVLKHLEKRCTATFCLQRWPAHGAFLPTQMCPKAKQALFGVFWGYFGCTPEKGLF